MTKLKSNDNLRLESRISRKGPGHQHFADPILEADSKQAEQGNNELGCKCTPNVNLEGWCHGPDH
jgi:hypothetical protein